MPPNKERPLPAPWVKRAIEREEGDKDDWGIVAETAIEIGFNGKPAAVMMASPSDIEDFAIGFALTEELLSDADAIENIAVDVFHEGVTVDIKAPEDALNMSRMRRRLLEGRTGCGLCGVETLAEAMRKPKRLISAANINDEAVLHAFDGMSAHQPLNAATRTAHAAAFATPDGEVRLVREDVGRHNALDKLIGAMARHGIDAGAGFVAMSSRCSFELVQKTAVAGAPLLATVSAPTTAALDLARAVGLEIRCLEKGALVRFGKE